MRRLSENLTSAIRALSENWLRSTLTMLGMIIGVGSVVLLVSIGRGVEADANRQIESIGTGTVIIVPGKLQGDGTPNIMATLGITTLTERDVATISALPGVRFCVPLMFVGGAAE